MVDIKEIVLQVSQVSKNEWAKFLAEYETVGRYCVTHESVDYELVQDRLFRLVSLLVNVRVTSLLAVVLRDQQKLVPAGKV